MSYASGFMVGTSIGKAVYDLFHNKKKGGSAFAGAPSMQGGKAADCRGLPAFPHSRAVVAIGLRPLSAMQGWPNSWKRKSVS